MIHCKLLLSVTKGLHEIPQHHPKNFQTGVRSDSFGVRLTKAERTDVEKKIDKHVLVLVGSSKLNTNFEFRLFGEVRRAHFGAFATNPLHRERATLERNGDFIRADMSYLTGRRDGFAALQACVEDAQWLAAISRVCAGLRVAAPNQIVNFHCWFRPI